MDIELLSRMVGELILDHDTVGLPGLGSFVAKVEPASFSDKGFIVNPPYRTLSFSSGDADDTTLSDYYASANHIDPSLASAIIREYVLKMREVLKSCKTIVFPGLGRLRATRGNEFFFVPDENLDIFPDAIGLEPVSLKAHDLSDEDVSMAVTRLSELIEKQDVPSHDVPIQDTSYGKAPLSEEKVSSAVPISWESTPPAAQSGQGHMILKRFPAWLRIILLLILSVAVLFCLFVLLSRVAPGITDRLLYTAEELEIINY